VRRWRFDRNPLRRATDRAETAVLAVLVAAFLVGTPFAALATGAWVHGMARQAQLAQEASRRQVTAIVLAVTAPPAGSEELAWQASARWKAPNGHAVTHEIPAPPGIAAGGKVQLWTDLTGDLTTAPLLDSQVAGQTVSGEALGVLASATVLTLAGAVALWTLNKRRMAAWDADWRAVCVPPAAGKLLLRRARLPFRRPDAAPRDTGRDDLDEHLPVPWGPGLDAGPPDRVLPRTSDVVSRALDEHAPPLPGGQVDAVDLERHLVVGARDARPQVLINRAVLRGAEHDRPVKQRVVHRQHSRPEPASVGDPADPAPCYQVQALIFAELFDHSVSHRGRSFQAS
jgi:hypothetical protein